MSDDKRGEKDSRFSIWLPHRIPMEPENLMLGCEYKPIRFRSHKMTLQEQILQVQISQAIQNLDGYLLCSNMIEAAAEAQDYYTSDELEEYTRASQEDQD